MSGYSKLIRRVLPMCRVMYSSLEIEHRDMLDPYKCYTHWAIIGLIFFGANIRSPTSTNCLKVNVFQKVHCGLPGLVTLHVWNVIVGVRCHKSLMSTMGFIYHLGIYITFTQAMASFVSTWPLMNLSDMNMLFTNRVYFLCDMTFPSAEKSSRHNELRYNCIVCSIGNNGNTEGNKAPAPFWYQYALLPSIIIFNRICLHNIFL